VTAYRVSDEELAKLLAGRADRLTFAPVAEAKFGRLEVIEPGRRVDLEVLRRPRGSQTPKGFFLPAAESVGRYGASESVASGAETGGLVVVGLRACELRAARYFDKVVLDKSIDDIRYRQRREAMTIVSCDCVDCAESCFCPLVGGAPFATEGYDVNISPLDDGWIVEVAGEKGQRLLAGAKFAEAGPGHLAHRDQIRRKMIDRLKSQNAKFKFTADDSTQPALPEGEDDGWQEFAADCVECGACTHICPTCHCFYLYDQLLGPEEFERVRTWDSCLLSTYHRMAGGENMKLTPRAKLSSRLANRVLHKFTYSPQQYGMMGCVGCGRCVDACLGAIDIRQVVHSLQAAREPVK